MCVRCPCVCVFVLHKFFRVFGIAFDICSCVYIYTDMDIDIDRFMFIFFYFIQQESQGVLV